MDMSQGRLNIISGKDLPFPKVRSCS
jgi:hypothetical protein